MTDNLLTYLRDLDGSGSLHACLKGDPGAIAFVNRGTARETFLVMLADAERFEAEYDGDETGGSTSYHLHLGRGFEELAEVLGISPGYMQDCKAAIDTALAACPGHVASDADPKVCRHCGTHVDEERPDDEEQQP